MPTYAALKLRKADAQAQAEAVSQALAGKTDIPPLITRLRGIVPFDQYCLSGLDFPGLSAGVDIVLSSDMPEAFVDTLLSKDLARVDPTLNAFSPERPWGSWHDLSPSDRARPELKPIILLERTHGISTRSTVLLFRGMHRFGSATFTRTTPFTDDEKLILESVARAVHCELCSGYVGQMNLHTGLTSGEIACLSAVASGLPLETAALTTGYTQETVTSYIKAATKKLGAANRTHAVAEAMRRRLIF